jgi:signal transduction histidine kinase
VLSELVDSVLPMIEPQLTERGLRRELQLAPGLVGLGDRPKAEQVLLNLLSNASKFTSRGGCVRVVSGVEPSDPARVWLEVQDTGVGIAADQLALVFDPFVQVDMSPSGRAEGTGLGLSISRDLARGMGGELTATSEPGAGSTFRLTLPAG